MLSKIRRTTSVVLGVTAILSAVAWLRSYRYEVWLHLGDPQKVTTIGLIKGRFVVGWLATDLPLPKSPTWTNQRITPQTYFNKWTYGGRKTYSGSSLTQWTRYGISFSHHRPHQWKKSEGWSICIPCSYITALLLTLPAFEAAIWVRRRRRRPPSTCLHCGYDLRATPDRCPECGKTTKTAELPNISQSKT